MASVAERIKLGRQARAATRVPQPPRPPPNGPVAPARLGRDPAARLQPAKRARPDRVTDLMRLAAVVEQGQARGGLLPGELLVFGGVLGLRKEEEAALLKDIGVHRSGLVAVETFVRYFDRVLVGLTDDKCEECLSKLMRVAHGCRERRRRARDEPPQPAGGKPQRPAAASRGEPPPPRRLASEEPAKCPVRGTRQLPAVPRGRAGAQGSGGRYVKLKVLGRGAFGVCHLVRDELTGAQLALKEVPLSGLDEQGRAAAYAEIAIMVRISQTLGGHPNIVKYHPTSSQPTSDVLSILMEYADGGDLKSLLKPGQGPVDEALLLPVIVQIALALHYLHSNKIVHRDLKPSNILFTPKQIDNGTIYIVKLADFGIAKVLETTCGGQTVVGTPQYMAPELYRGDAYGCLSDLWSMGVICYEMLAQRLPFGGSNILAITNQVVNEQPPPLPAQYSPEITGLAMSLLSKAPSDRPTPAMVVQAPVLSTVLLELIRREIVLPKDIPPVPVECFSPQTPSSVRDPSIQNGGFETCQFPQETMRKTIETMTELPQELWALDEAHPECSLCDAEFGFFRRRHHCRCCGGVFCSNCSGNRFELADSSGQLPAPKRVCDRCFVRLMEERYGPQQDSFVTAKMSSDRIS